MLACIHEWGRTVCVCRKAVVPCTQLAMHTHTVSSQGRQLQLVVLAQMHGAAALACPLHLPCSRCALACSVLILSMTPPSF